MMGASQAGAYHLSSETSPWDRGAESGFLQRAVFCEPDFLAQMPARRCSASDVHAHAQPPQRGAFVLRSGAVGTHNGAGVDGEGQLLTVAADRLISPALDQVRRRSSQSNNLGCPRPQCCAAGLTW
jgi:hypothetical protein